MKEVCSADDIDEGEIKGFEVEGHEILVAKVDGEFHALGDVCTHQHCLLSDGWLEGDAVVCPCHGASFDVETGEVQRPPAQEDEPTYPVEVRDGTVYVEV